MHYTSLGQQKLIFSEWDKFNTIFGSGKAPRRQLAENFETVVNMRNALSHPLPQGVAIPDVEIKRADVAAHDILNRLFRFMPPMSV